MMMWAKVKVAAACVLTSVVVAGVGAPLAINALAQDGEELIVGNPSVKKVEKGHEISFKVKKPTDVTVRIVDKKGEVVRHLASGMVGLEKAAKPFVSKALEQKITWDGKDDSGKDAPKGCKVSVTAGIHAKFDKFILWEKDGCARARHGVGYYAGNNDEYYAVQRSGVHLDTMRVFDSQGKFIRQAWPPNLNKSKDVLEKFLAGKWGAQDWDGDGVPIKVCMNSWYLFGTKSKGRTIQTSDGYVVGMFSGVGGGTYSINPDGFPHAWRWKSPWYDRKQNYKTKWSIAAGNDGDFYVTDNYHHVVGRFRAKDMSPVNSFTYNGKEKLAAPRCYLGEKGKTGTDEGHFEGPEGVGIDKDGNVCVLDGNKVKIYKKTGEFVKEADKTAFPGKKPVPQAVKDGEKHPRALCFPKFLRARADGKLFLMNCDRGKPIVMSDIEGKEFKTFKLPWAHSPYHGYSALDQEGNWYMVIGSRKKPQEVWKFSPDGKRAKFGDKDAVVIVQNDAFKLSKGISVGRNGDIYVVAQTNKWTQKAPDMTGGVKFGDLSARGEKACQTRVDVYGPDGTLKKKGIVKSVGINDVAVDRDGNIYVIDSTMWHGAQMAGVARDRRIYGKKHWPFPYLTPEQAKLDPKTQANKRYSLLCRLVKFSPEGGILDDPEGKTQIWDYASVSGVSPWNCDAECPASQICLDPDERLWVPDSYMYCIKAIDKAGNLVLRVGKYGNEDCKGGGGDKRHPELKNVVIDPEIPLSYPKGIAVYKDYLLISDMYAHRVMRCRLEYKDKKEAAVN